MTTINIKTGDLDKLAEKLENEINNMNSILERAKTSGNSVVDSWQSPSQVILSDKFKKFSDCFTAFSDDTSVYPEFMHYAAANWSNVDKTIAVTSDETPRA